MSMQRRRFRFIPARDANQRSLSVLSRQQQAWGFALPLALILGVAMTIAALTMLARSRTNSLVTQSQRRSAESLSASEGGIDRTLAQLNRPGFSGLLLVDNDPANLLPFDDPANPPDPTIVWTPDAAGDAFGKGCSLVKGEIGGGNGGGGVTIDIDELLAGSAGTGNYEMLAYRYYQSKGQGVMMMEGTSGTSISRVMQTITVVEDSEDPDLSFPGLLGFSDVDMGNNDVLGVDGNVICLEESNCPVNCFETEAQREVALRNAINAQNNSTIEGDIFVGEIELPPVPTAPTIFSRASTISITGASTFPAAGDIPVWIGPGTPSPLNICQTNPDPANCAYVYKINKIDVNGNKTVAIDFKQETTNSKILPVVFHVSGNINLGGNPQLITTYKGASTNGINDFPQAHFRIYGNPKGGAAQEITLNGNTCVDMFLYAPTAKAGINGGGSGCGILGAVWVDQWGLSNANAAGAVIRVREGTALAIKSALNADQFIGFGFAIAANRVDGIGGWARVDGEVR